MSVRWVLTNVPSNAPTVWEATPAAATLAFCWMAMEEAVVVRLHGVWVTCQGQYVCVYYVSAVQYKGSLYLSANV